jgi:hypothetical protein
VTPYHPVRYVIFWAALGFITSGTKALAHEPLWGEAASTVGDRVWHPDVKFEVQRNFRLMNGRDRVANTTDLSLSRITQRTSLDYGVGPKWNLRLEIPIERLRMKETVNGVSVRSHYTELGDVVLGAKYRFYLKPGQGTKDHQAVFAGFKLPTGDTSRRDSTGARLAPDMQPGSGTFGAVIGYMLTRETTKDSLWVSAFWEEPFRRKRFTPHRDLEFDASYGRWLKFPESLPDLGTMLTLGVHAHWHGKNRLPTGRDPNSGDSMLALHTTFIAQKDQFQLRLGVLIPIRQRVNGTQFAGRTEIRLGLEKFF